MNKQKLLAILVSLGILNGCAISGGKIEKKHDDIFKKSICRVNLPHIINGFGQWATLTIEKENSGIKTTLLTHDISSILMKNKNFNNNPSIIFKVFVNDQLIDYIKLKSQTLDVKDWDEYGYNGGHAHHSNATALIPLTMDQLKKISSADTATLMISDSKKSMEGKVSFSEIELLKQFITKCFV